ncbi:flagella synthesis protein FlgN [Salmonella enterica]
MMENLPLTLNKLLRLVKELEGTLTEEIRQLSHAQVNPIALQIISDNKSRLLSAINFYDVQRKDLEKKHQMASPYAQHPALATLWGDLTQIVRRASELNQRSFHLLEMHMKKMNDIKQLINQSSPSASLYGESGNQNNDGARNICRISV